MNLVDRIVRWLDNREGRHWLDTPAGCCECGTGGPYYEGNARQVTRYVYVDACGPAGDEPDWSSCSRHPLEGVSPVIDYGKDVEVTFRQTETGVAEAVAGKRYCFIPDCHSTVLRHTHPVPK